MKQNAIRPSRPVSRLLSGVAAILFTVLWACTAACAQTSPVMDYEYDAQGNLTQTTDALGRVTLMNYDALNRLRRTVQPAPGVGQPAPVIDTAYNPAGHLTAVTDPRLLATRYTSTGLGDLTQQVSPDTGTTLHTFDAAGNLKTRQDARNWTTRYSYDALNRVTRAQYGDNTATRFYYDEGSNGLGRLTRMIDPGPITTVWSYDSHGRVLSRSQTVNAGGASRTHTIVFSYDPVSGKRDSLTYPSGRILTLSYNAASLDLESLTFDGTQVADQIEWHGGLVMNGAVRSMGLANNQSWSSTIDQDGRLTSYTLGGATVTLTWNEVNQITDITHSTNNNRSQGLAYDDLDRLIALISPPRDQGFGYDLTGNLLSKSDRVGANPAVNYSYTIDAASNRMTRIANLGIDYGFDATGNRTTAPSVTHTYNARGRMIRSEVAQGTAIQTYNYLLNGLEQRVRKTGPGPIVPSGAQIFVYDNDGQLLGEYDNLGRARKEYIWLPDNQGGGPSYRPLALVAYTYSGTSTTPATQKLYAIETDHLGSPRRVSDTQNRTRWTWDPAPFGDTLPDENPQGLGAFTLNLRLPGQYFDKETNLHYNYHRDYVAAEGRYLQPDPLGIRAGLGTYLYALNQPTRYIDPEGLQAVGIITGGGRAVGGGVVVGGGRAGSRGGSVSNTGVPEIDNALNGPRASEKGLLDRLFCPPDCSDLQRQMEAVAAELRVRYLHMTVDVQSLFCTRPIGKFSWAGHQYRYLVKQKQLRRLMDQARAMGCWIDPEHERLLNTPPPMCPVG